ncbi:hypothetical protein EYF80_043451 [Liparis tanakae]|uniref:Uncharacterized protein n=1 Tax=Liparis tanakae TaxID=230148 RepID=A0A4Z2G0E9_9TELE|nr:hypothetical protein EYF80_043451 [Liparis tanakae]
MLSDSGPLRYKPSLQLRVFLETISSSVASPLSPCVDSIYHRPVGSQQGAVGARHLPVVRGGETIEEAQAVLLHRHLAQLVLQTDGVDVDSLMTQEHRLKEHEECERGVVGLEAQQAAGSEVAVLLVVDDRGALQQELVDVWLQRQHGMSSVPWLKARCVSSVPWNSTSFTTGSDDKSPSESDRSPTMNLRTGRVGDGPVVEGLVEASSGSSASKLRLQDLRSRKRRIRLEKKVKKTDGRVQTHRLLSENHLMIWRMLLTVASFSGACSPSGPERDRKLCWPL